MIKCWIDKMIEYCSQKRRVKNSTAFNNPGIQTLVRNNDEVTYPVSPASPAGGLILFAPDCVIPKVFGMPCQGQK